MPGANVNRETDPGREEAFGRKSRPKRRPDPNRRSATAMKHTIAAISNASN